MTFNLRPKEANLTKREEECGVKARIPGRGRACAKPLRWVFGVKGDRCCWSILKGERYMR